MADTDRLISAHVIEERNELHYACGGLWDAQSIDDMFETLNRACMPLVKSGKPFSSIGDFSTAMPQDSETADKIGAHLRSAMQFGLQRIAIFGAAPLMKLQYKRVAPEIEMEFFETEEDALAWVRRDH